MTDPSGDPAPQPPAEPTPQPPTAPAMPPPPAAERPTVQQPVTQQPSQWKRTVRSRPLQLVAVGLLGVLLGCLLGGGVAAVAFRHFDHGRDFGRNEKCVAMRDRNDDRGNRGGQRMICRPDGNGPRRMGPGRQLPPGQPGRFPPGQKPVAPSPSAPAPSGS